MNAESKAQVQVVRRFKATAQRVYDAFLDPQKAGKFMFATPTGEMVRVQIDARVGGTYIFTDRRDGEGVVHTGQYLELDRPRRIVFTLQVEKYGQDIDRVSIDIRELSSGCELTLTHEMSATWRDARGMVEAGWKGILEAVAQALDEPYVKQLYVEKFIDIAAPASRVWQVLTDPQLSRQWTATWWPGVTIESDWTMGGTIVWRTSEGEVGAQGRVVVLHPYLALEYTFKVNIPGSEKEERLNFMLSEGDGTTKLTVRVGNFGDTPEHEACYPGAVEAWNLSLPKIKELAQV